MYLTQTTQEHTNWTDREKAQRSSTEACESMHRKIARILQTKITSEIAVQKVNELSYRPEPSWSVDSFAISERSESVSLLLL